MTAVFSLMFSSCFNINIYPVLPSNISEQPIAFTVMLFGCVSSGMEFLVPKTGFFCKVCNRFFSGTKEAEISHCKTAKHYENLLVGNTVMCVGHCTLLNTCCNGCENHSYVQLKFPFSFSSRNTCRT